MSSAWKFVTPFSILHSYLNSTKSCWSRHIQGAFLWKAFPDFPDWAEDSPLCCYGHDPFSLIKVRKSAHTTLLLKIFQRLPMSLKALTMSCSTLPAFLIIPLTSTLTTPFSFSELKHATPLGLQEELKCFPWKSMWLTSLSPPNLCRNVPLINEAYKLPYFNLQFVALLSTSTLLLLFCSFFYSTYSLQSNDIIFLWLFFNVCLSLLEYKLHNGGNFYLFCSFKFSKYLQW